jgi:hypothetical protein
MKNLEAVRGREKAGSFGCFGLSEAVLFHYHIIETGIP